MGIFILFASSCKKEVDNKGIQILPNLFTTEVTDISTKTATSGGIISGEGGKTVTARGVCWRAGNEFPTINDNKTEDGSGTGSFTSIIRGLEPNTRYIISAYATNNVGTVYGAPRAFTTQREVGVFNSFTDPRDGKVYKTVRIGDQDWMAENLAFKPDSGIYCAYDFDLSNIETYGYLYDWETAMVVCPAGWHLPSIEEWNELKDYSGGSLDAGRELKTTGTIEDGTGLWHAPNICSDNRIGFSALPGGNRISPHGNFEGQGSAGFWWSATERFAGNAWSLVINNGIPHLANSYSYTDESNSVRCVRD